MKDMGIRYEKFHTRNTKSPQKSEPRTPVKKDQKTTRQFKDKPKTDL